MKYVNRRESIRLANQFISKRFSVRDISFEEIILRNYLISLHWENMEENVRGNYLNENLLLAKREIEERSRNQTWDVKSLCGMGHSLHCVQNKLHCLNKMTVSYQAYALSWIRSYIRQVERFSSQGDIDLSYESGVCCAIRYMLCEEAFFQDAILRLTELFLDLFAIQSEKKDLNFGMRYGWNGYLWTLNQFRKKYLDCGNVKKAVCDMVRIFLEKRRFDKDLSFWPAIISANGKEVHNISDSWSYGSTMTLMNLQESVELFEIPEQGFLDELKMRCNLCVGDLCFTDAGHDTGYAGALRLFETAFRKYRLPCFGYMKECLAEELLREHTTDGVYSFFKYNVADGNLKKESDVGRDAVRESYMIYIVLLFAGYVE